MACSSDRSSMFHGFPADRSSGSRGRVPSLNEDAARFWLPAARSPGASHFDSDSSNVFITSFVPIATPSRCWFFVSLLTPDASTGYFSLPAASPRAAGLSYHPCFLDQHHAPPFLIVPASSRETSWRPSVFRAELRTREQRNKSRGRERIGRRKSTRGMRYGLVEKLIESTLGN